LVDYGFALFVVACEMCCCAWESGELSFDWGSRGAGVAGSGHGGVEQARRLTGSTESERKEIERSDNREELDVGDHLGIPMDSMWG